ncbi:hypothetical protein Dimus_029112, partial [Dionaea muscipula]
MQQGEGSGLDNRKRQWIAKGVEASLPCPTMKGGQSAGTKGGQIVATKGVVLERPDKVSGGNAEWKAVEGKKARVGSMPSDGQSNLEVQSRFSPLELQ